MHYYRLFNDGCEGYGLFHEPRDGFGPTAKGTAFQKLSGATADLSRYVIKEGQYMSGDNLHCVFLPRPQVHVNIRLGLEPVWH